MKSDLKRLAQLAYHRLEYSGDTVKAFHRLRKTFGKHPDFPLLEQAYAWVLMPFCLWAIDFHTLCRLIQERIEAGRGIDDDFRLLVNTLPPLPDENAQTAAAEHEHAVQHGSYESLIEAQHKFDAAELLLADNLVFQREWQKINSSFDIAKFQDHKQIIRRRMVTERNMCNNTSIRWENKAGRFQAVFDVFCQRWNLYGMKGDMPLLLKLSVNLTPFGTMIFIPAYWSFDLKRDLKCKVISTLHDSRGVRKQGRKLAMGRAERKKDAERLQELDKEADLRGFKGDKKHAFLCAGLGWVSETSPKRLIRLRTEFEDYRAEKLSE